MTNKEELGLTVQIERTEFGGIYFYTNRAIAIVRVRAQRRRL